MLFFILAFFSFLFFKNFQPTGAVVLDIKEDATMTLTPKDRIIEEDDIQELAGGLVYFTSVVPGRAQDVKIRVWFKDQFPEQSTFSVGARNKPEWSYSYAKIFEKTWNKPTYTLETLPKEFPFGSVIYNPDDVALAQNITIENITSSRTLLEHALRGKHDAYVYLTEPLSLNIEKRDLNWYENSDELKVKLYDHEDLLGAVIIDDDGVITKNQSISRRQEGMLVQEDEFHEGVYRIEFANNDDLLITKIKGNIPKLVFPKLFLGDNKVYGVPDRNASIFAYLSDGVLYLQTNHQAGLQNLRIDHLPFHFTTEDKPIKIDLSPGFHTLFLEKGDVILRGNRGSYFSFDEQQYFHPYQFYETNNPKDADVIVLQELPKNNVKEEDGWLKAEATFALNNTYINEKRELSFVFNTPHLTKNETMNYTIPVKKIEVEYYQEPLI